MTRTYFVTRAHTHTHIQQHLLSSPSRAILYYVIDFPVCTSDIITLNLTEQNLIWDWISKRTSLRISVTVTVVSMCVCRWVGWKWIYKKMKPGLFRNMGILCVSNFMCLFCVELLFTTVFGEFPCLGASAEMLLWIYGVSDPFPSTALPLFFIPVSLWLACTLV